MITRYEIRSTKDGRIIQPNRLPFLVYATHSEEKDALSAALSIIQEDRGKEDSIFITKTEYANDDSMRRDFQITSSVVWSGYFHGADALRKMIEARN